jgi:FkbM family methyltransferase
MSGKLLSAFAPSSLKSLLHRTLSSFGYKLIKTTHEAGIRAPLQSARQLLGDKHASPFVIFDVGANIGQTTSIAREMFPEAVIHAFEPGNEAFRGLSERMRGDARIHLHQVAVGATPGEIELQENENPTMSSVLPLGDEAWGRVKTVRKVEMVTVDQMAERHGVREIAILKSDTQGYDLEVLRGASKMLEREAIACVFFEIIFTDLYRGLPRFDETIRYLMDRGFVLGGIHDIHSRGGIAAWADFLFIHQRFVKPQTSA